MYNIGSIIFSVVSFFRIQSLPSYTRKFCLDLVKRTVEEREKNGIVRKDLMQFLIQLRNNSETADRDNDWNFINSSALSHLQSNFLIVSITNVLSLFFL
jgi:cytochrome P450 family 6